MSVRQSLGKVAVVPKGSWDGTKTYEFLDIVKSGGGSYIARQDVPIGIAITNTEYWVSLVDKGGIGDDGVSPSVTVTPITGGHRVTITDAEHPQGQSFAVMNGSGIPEDVKVALLDCFENVAWINDQGQTYYDALYAALYPPADLVSISAIFNQGQNIVYDTDSLDSLKQYLTVRGNYSDASIRTITTYTLSGTLTVGTSTITVGYGGKTATFNVVVTRYGALPAEYQEVEYITSPGGSGNAPYIDTGIMLSGSHSLKTIARMNGTTQSSSNFIGVNDNLSGAARAFGLISFRSAGKIGFFLFGGSAQAIPYDNQFHEYVISASECSVDGTEYELTGVVDTSITQARSLYLFAFRVSSNVDYCASSLGRTEIDDGSTKKTFVPCYRKADGVIGMFELTSGTFHTNDGGGSFAKGGDIS